ncbi:MAG: ABC transporter permease [Chloroflexi bacterium]|nr:MAG: ABC transporter permease [Chloroflexota bacterium]
MWVFLGKRLIQMIITLLLFQAATFFLLEAQPVDIADLLTLNPQIPPSERDKLRTDLGLDKPPVQRFFTYLGNFYTGDWGVSFSQYPRSVTDIISERLPRTLVLFITSTITALWAGYFTGRILAWRRGGVLEYSQTLVGVGLYTVFTPWFALMMIWLFAVTLDWLPAGKFLDPLKWIQAPVDANTVFIWMIWSAAIAVLVVVFGFWLATKVGRYSRRWVRWGSFVVALVGIVLFWTLNGYGRYAADILKHLVLPVLTLTLIAYGGYMLLMRTSMLETLREDYILSARAKGLPEKEVRDKHAARNAMLPLWTSLVFAIGAAVSGGVITETIFSWPGIGLTLLNASTVNDIPLAMGAFTIIGVMTLLAHLAADLGYAFLDPRIRVH